MTIRIWAVPGGSMRTLLVHLADAADQLAITQLVHALRQAWRGRVARIGRYREGRRR